MGAETARDGRTRGDADSNLDRRQRLAVHAAFLGDDFVDPRDHFHHAARRFAGMDGVLGIVQRCIPEARESFAGDPFDGAAMREGLVHQWREHTRQQPRERDRIVAKALRQCREAAYAADEIGHLARLALELEQRRLARDLFDCRRRKRIGESRVQPSARSRDLRDPPRCSCGEDHRDAEAWPERVEENVVCSIKLPGHAACPGDRGDGK